MVERFCAKCGKITKRLIRNLCEEHFLEAHSEIIKVPTEIKIEVDKFTQKIRLRGKWINQSENDLIDLVVSKVKIIDLQHVKIGVTLNALDNGNTIARVVVNGVIENVPLTITKNVLLSAHIVVSDASMKIRSNYHEALIQIRGNKSISKDLYSEVAREIREQLSFLEEKDPLAGVVGESKVTNGFDTKIGSRRAARLVSSYLAKKFDTKVVDTYTLIGEKNGKKKYRYTYLVRIS